MTGDNLWYSSVFTNITTFRIKEKNYLIYPTPFTFLHFSPYLVLRTSCSQWMPGVVVVSRSAALLLYKVAEQNCEMKFGDRVWPPRLG